MLTVVNAVGLPGPTTNYAVSVKGNNASENNFGQTSYPKKAALQVLDAMLELHQRGLPQIVLPPHQRPYTRLLKNLGFTGNDFARVAEEEPDLLPLIYSGNHIYTANSATVTRKGDKIHMSIANMHANPHRGASEGVDNYNMFKQIFTGPNYIIHEPLQSHTAWGDEGKANHLQLGELSVFVYGKQTLSGGKFADNFPLARQSLEASRAIARRHQLTKGEVLYLEQNPYAIEQGVFHQDVIGVCANTADETTLLIHENAFENFYETYEKIKDAFYKLTPDGNLVTVVIPENLLTVAEAVDTYFFNSRLDILPDGRILLVAPIETKENPRSATLVQRLIKDDKMPIDDVVYVDVRESMKNGGGPACLRLPVAMTEDEINKIRLGRANVFFTEKLYNQLKEAVNLYYPDKIEPQNLAKPELAEMALAALEEIQEILKVAIIEKAPSRFNR